MGELRPLIVSAPFGNYVQPRGVTATLGTFTLAARPGRLWRIVRTVRYYPRLRAWVNKIGLRNPGIAWLEGRAKGGKIDLSDKIVSVHGFDEGEWRGVVERAVALRPLAVELNMSCPNIGHVNWPKWLFGEAVAQRAGGVMVIVKLPPVNYRAMFDQAIGAGVRVFHCCNTLPVPAGGVSGKPLMPVALACIGDVLGRVDARTRAELTIIGGGGITTPEDVEAYARAGANRFAVGTKVFHPKYLWSDAGLRDVREKAEEMARGAGAKGPGRTTGSP